MHAHMLNLLILNTVVTQCSKFVKKLACPDDTLANFVMWNSEKLPKSCMSWQKFAWVRPQDKLKFWTVLLLLVLVTLFCLFSFLILHFAKVYCSSVYILQIQVPIKIAMLRDNFNKKVSNVPVILNEIWAILKLPKMKDR